MGTNTKVNNFAPGNLITVKKQYYTGDPKTSFIGIIIGICKLENNFPLVLHNGISVIILFNDFGGKTSIEYCPAFESILYYRKI